VPLLLCPPFFPIIIFFWSTTLLTRMMTGISLHVQWPLTSHAPGSVPQREQLVYSLRIEFHAPPLRSYPPRYTPYLTADALFPFHIQLSRFAESVISCPTEPFLMEKKLCFNRVKSRLHANKNNSLRTNKCLGATKN
jgi:hypothetical protein